MNCATHPNIAAVAFCRTCGKPLCANCTRDVRGVVYCEPCLAARLEGTAPAAGFVPPAQTGYAPVGQPSGTLPAVPFRPAGSSGPNPAVAGILAGFFPFGVGAVYCSQYAKGLAHLIIFAMLIFASDHAGRWDWVFGIGIAFFYVYQIIDAVRTARALQMGEPPPDPYGLAQTFSMGERSEYKNIPAVAIILIGLGVLFLLHTMNIFEFGLDRFWPLLLILFGGWMFARQWGLIAGRRIGCTCDRCRMRKIIGPAILITIGILFLLQSLNVVEFDRTWPAILLVIGVVKLLQSNASSAGHVGSFQPTPPVVAPPAAAPPSNPGASNPGATPPSGEVHNV
ncbi:MAG TPA: B-box zinc finger protein [Candidatus Eremiobacteraceae bacterium]|nr:B-box zinc finger protein [Candidatus Eremiobacteraceae bacterium]